MSKILQCTGTEGALSHVPMFVRLRNSTRLRCNSLYLHLQENVVDERASRNSTYTVILPDILNLVAASDNTRKRNNDATVPSRASCSYRKAAVEVASRVLQWGAGWKTQADVRAIKKSVEGMASPQ
eukprot:scaffold72890_cov52-Attheya_sp.AAC.1